MKEFEKKIRMELLERLISEMDDSIMESVSPKQEEDDEPVVHIKEVSETKELPDDEARDFIEKKMGVDSDEDTEEVDEDDEEFGDSRLMQKLRQMKKQKDC
jgi:hypothetical protein